MATTHSLTRRSAIAGLGAGSLGLFLGASAAVAESSVETGGSGGGKLLSTTTHPLAGRWLSRLALPSRPDIEVTAPTFFGADGTVVMCLPSVEAEEQGIHAGGIALGCWEPMAADLGHFTAVQAMSNLDGEYIGTVTIDGYAQTDAEGLGFAVRSEDNLFVVRDAGDAVVEELFASTAHPMRGLKMRVGSAGFVEKAAPRRKDDPRMPH